MKTPSFCARRGFPPYRMLLLGSLREYPCCSSHSRSAFMLQVLGCSIFSYCAKGTRFAETRGYSPWTLIFSPSDGGCSFGGRNHSRGRPPLQGRIFFFCLRPDVLKTENLHLSALAPLCY